MSGQQRKLNKSLKKALNQNIQKVEDRDQPVKGTTFVLHGSIPANNKKRVTQACLKKEIQSKGGRVKTTIPYRQKGISKKKYIVLTTQDCIEKKKTPSIVKIAIRRKFDILDYSYIFACLQNENTGNVSKEVFRLNTDKISSHITKDVSIEKKHFYKSKTFLSIMKKARKNKIKKMTKPTIRSRQTKKILGTNSAQYFVSTCLKKTGKITSLDERRKVVSDLFKQWVELPNHVKSEYKKGWIESNLVQKK